MHSRFVLAASLILVSLLRFDAAAQPPFGGGPFGQGGPQGGFGGPPFGMQGGPPGGGDRSSRGGAPGGDRSSRGGPPGGDRGGFPGGPPGGFDPAAMLSRLDANGNGSIDPDEMQGPARFMLDRLGRDNPEIATAMSSSKPIPLSKITKAVEKMRGDRGSDSNSNSNGSSNNNSSSTSSGPKEPEPLVPGFGVAKETVPILGFGVEGSQAVTVKVDEDDLKEAAERMQRYDANKDGILDEKEIREGRWSDNPMQFDRNGDKKLSVKELAVRYAKRRVAEEAEKANRQSGSSSNRNDPRRRGEEGSRGSKDENAAPQSPWTNQASYKFTPRFGPAAKVQGLPEWFASSDANQDGQVMMNEYASNWDEGTLKEFARFDSNGDGTITTLETLAAVKKGVLRGAAAPASSSTSAGSTASAMPAAKGSASIVTTPPTNIDRSDLPADAEERWVQFVALQIKKSDKDQNARLTVDEWSASSGDFAAVDKNGDGSISLGEFYLFRVKKK